MHFQTSRQTRDESGWEHDSTGESADLYSTAWQLGALLGWITNRSRGRPLGEARRSLNIRG